MLGFCLFAWSLSLSLSLSTPQENLVSLLRQMQELKVLVCPPGVSLAAVLCLLSHRRDARPLSPHASDLLVVIQPYCRGWQTGLC